MASLVTLVIGATGVVVELQEALNDVWKVRPKPGRPIQTFARARLTSLVMGIGIGVLMLASLILTATGDRRPSGSTPRVPVAGSTTVVQAVNVITLFGAEALLFAMIFKFLPNAKLGSGLGVGTGVDPDPPCTRPVHLSGRFWSDCI